MDRKRYFLVTSKVPCVGPMRDGKKKVKKFDEYACRRKKQTTNFRRGLISLEGARIILNFSTNQPTDRWVSQASRAYLSLARTLPLQSPVPKSPPPRLAASPAAAPICERRWPLPHSYTNPVARKHPPPTPPTNSPGCVRGEGDTARA